MYTTFDCSVCGSSAIEGSRFCSNCGSTLAREDIPAISEMPSIDSDQAVEGELVQESPEVGESLLESFPIAVREAEPVADDAQGMIQETGVEATSTSSGRRRLMVAAVAAGVLAVGGAGFLGYTAYQSEQAEIVAVEKVESDLSGLFEALSGSKTTKDLRAVGSSAADMQGQLPGFDKDSERDGQMGRTGDLLASLASLKSIDADTLGTWTSVRKSIEGAVDAMKNDIGVQAAPAALTAADAVVVRGKAAMATWEKAVKKAEAKSSKELAAAQLYESNVRSTMERYEALRTEASEWIDRTDSAGRYYVRDAVDFFESAASSRRGIRDSLTYESVPAGIRAEHDALTDSVTTGIGAIESMVQAIRDAQNCYYTDCYLYDQPGFQDFRQGSAEVSQRWSSARAAWESAIAAILAEAGSGSLPAKPVV